MPSSTASQHLLHCIFVLSAAGFDCAPGMCSLIIFVLCFCGWGWHGGVTVN